MDVVTYALLKKRIDNISLAYSYKGSVPTIADLPQDAETGDLYTVGGDEYVWDGTAWVKTSEAITDAQIDALFE